MASISNDSYSNKRMNDSNATGMTKLCIKTFLRNKCSNIPIHAVVHAAKFAVETTDIAIVET